MAIDLRGALAGLVLAGLLAIVVHPACAVPRRLHLPWTNGPVPTLIEYFCSPGFEPRNGACVAVMSRDELDIHESDARPAPRARRRPRDRASRDLDRDR